MAAIHEPRTYTAVAHHCYGLARNRKAMEAVTQFAQNQKILPRQVNPEEMFANNTLDLE